MTTINPDLELEAATAALLALAEHNIPTDVQELLVYGDPRTGIKPGALSKAVRAVLSHMTRIHIKSSRQER